MNHLAITTEAAEALRRKTGALVLPGDMTESKRFIVVEVDDEVMGALCERMYPAIQAGDFEDFIELTSRIILELCGSP